MDEVEQDTSGFLPLVGITEVSKRIENRLSIIISYYCARLIHLFMF